MRLYTEAMSYSPGRKNEQADGPDVHDTLRMSRAELDELVRQSSWPPPDPEDIDLADERLDGD